MTLKNTPREICRQSSPQNGMKGEALRPRASSTVEVSSRSRLSLNKITIGIIPTVKCYIRLYSAKNWEFRTTCQLATCDDRRPCIGLDLSPYTIITHSVKRWKSRSSPVIFKLRPAGHLF
ncbi:hypothetical protein TNCV_3419971 [Trichonephila clavipes]|nr:hypothetical protein TNCV_3419971 [Trichonephila clavipes]